MFHNTNDESGDELARSESKATAQETVVLWFFEEHPDVPLAVHEVHQRAFPSSVPLTSIRRAVTNLANKGHLEKTPVCARGPYGKSVHTWAYRAPRSILGIDWETA